MILQRGLISQRGGYGCVTACPLLDLSKGLAWGSPQAWVLGDSLCMVGTVFDIFPLERTRSNTHWRSYCLCLGKGPVRCGAGFCGDQGHGLTHWCGWPVTASEHQGAVALLHAVKPPTTRMQLHESARLFGTIHTTCCMQEGTAARRPASEPVQRAPLTARTRQVCRLRSRWRTDSLL